jgi:uncharacterized RDD family membrane protein YckC
MVSHRSLFLVLTLLVSTATLRTARAGTYDLFAEGADERLWTAQVVSNADKNLPNQRTVIRVRGAGDSERWRQVAEIAKEASSLTHRGGELVVLLEDGDWRFVSDSGIRSGDRLPGNVPVLAIAGDGQTLWAVGLAPEPTTTTSTAPTTHATTRPGDVERTAATAATTRAATGPLPTFLYRLDRGRWTPIVQLPSRLLPLGDLAAPNALRMTVLDGRPLLAGRMLDGSIHTVQLADGNVWLDRGVIKPAFNVRRHELFVHRGRAMLWLAAEVSAGDVYQLADRWQGPTALRTQPPLGPGYDRAIAVAFGRLRLLYVGGDGLLTEQSFNADGMAEGPPTQAKVQSQPPDPRITQFVQLGVMLLLMFVMLSTLRRRGSIQDAMRRAHKLPLAPLVIRFLAGVVDALPLIAVPAFIVFSAPAMDSAQLQDRMNDPAVQAWEGAAALFYLAYTALSEALFGRTLGKLLFGLRVVNLDGSRVRPRAALLRNVLRIVDLTLALFPLVMVFLSPLRQRIGDVAAGTLVVRAGVIVPPPASSSDATDDV